MDNTNSKKRISRFPFWVIIFLLGIAMGASIFYILEKRVARRESHKSEPVKEAKKSLKQEITASEKTPVVSDNVKKDTTRDTLEISQSVQKADTLDTKNSFSLPDNTISQNVAIGLKNDNREIAEDELIFVKFINLPPEQETSSIDALLINDKTPKKPNTLRVEFWVSPINYTGYRMDSFKLLLFGIKEPEKAVFQFHEKEIYLEYKNQHFVLTETDDFKPLNIKRSKP